MDDPKDEVTALKARVERTERHLRIVVLAFLLSIAALSFTVLIRPAASQQVPGSIKARNIEVVDDAGKPRISLRVSSILGKEAEMDILDESGAVRFRVSANGAGALVAIGRQPLEQSDGPQITLQTLGSPGGSSLSGISITGGIASRGNVTLAVVPDLGPRITLMDQGRAVFKAP